MSKRLLLIATFLTALLSGSHALAIEIGKPIKATVHISRNNAHGISATKDVYLMNIKLTSAERSSLMSFTPRMHQLDHVKTDLPSAVNLGMNGVPVLSQGQHGTCATFANTAAIDAALGKGDYISQLCQLELGEYLEADTYMPSGWDGSLGPWVLDQMMRYGVVSNDNQKIKSCAGIRQYPTSYLYRGNAMNEDDYRALSEDLSEKIYPLYHMNAIQRYESRFANNGSTENALLQVKQALVKGNRLTFGSFLVLSAYCDAGACASYHMAHDTWALTKEIETPPYFTAGHEMVIVGYDDNAIATDEAGNLHQGLLTLRNSWGDDVGDHGNFYMTYDYFKKFVTELQEIVVIKNR